MMQATAISELVHIADGPAIIEGMLEVQRPRHRALRAWQWLQPFEPAQQRR